MILLMRTGTKKLKLLKIGASGFIGHEVSRQLSLEGYRPRLMIRHPGDDCEICHFDADIVVADLRNPNSLPHAVKGIDGMIHLGARATFESYATLNPSILDGSVALMRAAIDAGGVDLFTVPACWYIRVQHLWWMPAHRPTRFWTAVASKWIPKNSFQRWPHLLGFPLRPFACQMYMVFAISISASCRPAAWYWRVWERTPTATFTWRTGNGYLG
jgi:hypothetical protein